MRHQPLPAVIVTLGSLALAGCGNEATGPSPASTTTSPATPLAAASNAWLTRADMLTTRTDLAIATVTNAAGQSVIYTIGGLNPNGVPLKTVTAYNVATNTWTFRRALPAPLAWTNGAGVINGKIYVSGGFSEYGQGDGYPSKALYLYDPVANTWTRKHDMPSLYGPPDWNNFALGSEGVTGVINGKLYVVTACSVANEPWGYQEGCDGKGAWFLRYNPATDRWAMLPSPFPAAARPPFVGGVIAGKLYVMAASRYTHDGYLAAYDPATNLWSTKNALGLARPGAATAVLAGRLYVMGGVRFDPVREDYDTLDKTIAYNPATNLWTPRASMPSRRSGIAATVVRVNGQSRIEVVGGQAPGNNLQYVP